MNRVSCTPNRANTGFGLNDKQLTGGLEKQTCITGHKLFDNTNFLLPIVVIYPKQGFINLLTTEYPGLLQQAGKTNPFCGIFGQ